MVVFYKYHLWWLSFDHSSSHYCAWYKDTETAHDAVDAHEEGLAKAFPFKEEGWLEDGDFVVMTEEVKY